MDRALHSLGGLHAEETGQDLLEYALVMALIALAAVAGMGVLASSLNATFSKLGNLLQKQAP